MEERIGAPERAPEKKEDDGTREAESLRSLCPTERAWNSNRWNWKLAWTLPLLLSVVCPYNFLHNTGITNNNHQESLDRQNRQLLEHGLRGGNDEPSESTNRPSVQTYHAKTTTVLVSNVTVPLYAHSGTHHVYLYIGSPPQKQTLIVDTGSRAMAFPCKTSENAGDCCGVHASDYFDPSQSTTHLVSVCGNCLLKGISECDQQQLGSKTPSNEIGCAFSQKYTEGSSWRATEVEDIVWLGNPDASQSLQDFLPKLAVAYPFGCQTSTSGLFRKQHADGILGLSIHETSLIHSFYREGLIASNSFSLCLTHKGGVLSLGGTLDPTKYHRGNGETATMKTTPVTNQNEQRHGYYSAEVIRLVVGNSIVVTDANTKPRLLKDMNAGNGCVLDSGTTDSYFPASLSRAIRRAVVSYGMAQGDAASANAMYHEHLGFSDDTLDLFSPKLRQRDFTFAEFETMLPTITVVFANDVQLTILPQYYMEDVPLNAETGEIVPWEGTRRLTNRLYFEERKGSVLGQNALFGYEVLFDAGDFASNEARIGIVRADCHAAAQNFPTLDSAAIE